MNIIRLMAATACVAAFCGGLPAASLAEETHPEAAAPIVALGLFKNGTVTVTRRVAPPAGGSAFFLPGTGTTTFQYNALGELIAQSDNGGYRTEHEIDARGRVWRITAKLPDGSVESQRVSVFDTVAGGIGQLSSDTVTGQYAAWSGQSGMGLNYRRDIGYDAMGRVVHALTWTGQSSVDTQSPLCA